MVYWVLYRLARDYYSLVGAEERETERQKRGARERERERDREISFGWNPGCLERKTWLCTFPLVDGLVSGERPRLAVVPLPGSALRLGP